MSNILGGLNYDATLSAEDYTANRDLLEAEILTRFLLSTGYPPGTAPATGIADLIDPSAISASETTRPYLVTVSTLDPLQIAVNPGVAVTPTGAVIQSSLVFSMLLARTQANDINIVFVENTIIPGGSQLLNDYQESLNSQDVQGPSTPSCALIGDWNNVSLFPPSRKNNIVVLAVVSVLSTSGGGLSLQIDMTRNTYAFNRPWFTIMDLQHRSQIGSGTVTPTNPHATTLNDLSTAGNVALFQGLVDTGMVVSRDRTIAKMVGAMYCSEQITLSRIQVDDKNGSVTSRSIYGGPYAHFCLLAAFPTRLGSLYATATPANSIACDLIEGTNILVFAPEETAQTMTVEYTQSQALMPPVSVSTTLLTFSTPITDEILVAGGNTIVTVPDPTLDMVGSGPFPRRYSVYCLGNASLMCYPQILFPATNLNSFGTAAQTLQTPIMYPARIRVGITQASTAPQMSISVTLSGLDVTGAPLNETLTISTATGYVDEALGSTNYDSDKQQVVSQNIFATLTSFVVNRVTDPTSGTPYDGTMTVIQVWADSEPSTSPELNDALKIVNIGWNGQGISLIEDARVISKGFFRPNQIALSGNMALDPGKLLATGCPRPQASLLFSEDFEDLRFFDSARGFVGPINATGSITLSNLLLTPGDLITLRPQRGSASAQVLTFRSPTYVGQAAPGDVQIGTDVPTTLGNILAAIQKSFSTSFLATSASGTINLTTQDLIGAAGNIPITTSNTQGALTLVGSQAGFDAIGECYLDRAVIGLKSVKVPASTLLNPTGYSYRSRYRSRAFALAGGIGQTQFAIEILQEAVYLPGSVRIRGATLGAPDQWLPWQLATVSTVAATGVKGVYLSTFTQPVYKIQVEYYGRARGCSVFSIQ